MLKSTGVLFFWIGVGAGTPPYCFKRGYSFFIESKKMKEIGAKLSLDHEGARSTFTFYFLGGFISFIGCTFLLIDFIIGA